MFDIADRVGSCETEGITISLAVLYKIEVVGSKMEVVVSSN